MSAESHNKPCTLCGQSRAVLVRCQIDDSGRWHLICPGKCWKSVSGGQEDARGFEAEYPHYRYGGMWKNKHADGPISAKKPEKVKKRQKEERAQQQKADQVSDDRADVGEQDEA